MAKDKKYPYPSRYGSHASMVVRELEGNKVVLKDEFGEYETYRKRLDNGSADPFRYGPNRVSMQKGQTL